jgi:hypothetical protein
MKRGRRQRLQKQSCFVESHHQPIFSIEILFSGSLSFLAPNIEKKTKTKINSFIVY